MITVPYDPKRAAEVLDIRGAVDAMHRRGMSEDLIKKRIAENPIWRKAFWKEGPYYFTSVGNLIRMHQELGDDFANQTGAST